MFFRASNNIIRNSQSLIKPLVTLQIVTDVFNPYFETPFRRYSSVPFPVSKHVRPKGVRLLVQRHDVLGDALTEQRLVLPPPTGRLPGHQALRHVMPPRTIQDGVTDSSHAAERSETRTNE